MNKLFEDPDLNAFQKSNYLLPKCISESCVSSLWYIVEDQNKRAHLWFPSKSLISSLRIFIFWIQLKQEKISQKESLEFFFKQRVILCCLSDYIYIFSCHSFEITFIGSILIHFVWSFYSHRYIKSLIQIPKGRVQYLAPSAAVSQISGNNFEEKVSLDGLKKVHTLSDTHTFKNYWKNISSIVQFQCSFLNWKALTV